MIQVPGNFLTANASPADDVTKISKLAIYRLEIESYGRIFVSIPIIGNGTDLELAEPLATGEFNWIADMENLAISVSDLDGGANLGTLSVTVQDWMGKITADLPGSLLEGKKVTLTTGFPGMSRADYATLFTGVVDTIVGTNNNLEYIFNCVDTSQVLQKVIFPVGDSGRATDSANTRTLNGHPLDILVDVLMNEVGLDATQINLAKIYGYRDGTYAGMQMTFEIDSPPVAKDFIENEILKPLGGYRWTNSRGQFDVNFFYPTSIIPVFSGALIGAFADGTGALVAKPFLIANGGSFKVPAGATQLQMGVNDHFFTDNGGSWSVSVNGASPVTVNGTAKPYSVSGGLNSAYPFTDTGATSPTVVAVTAGTTISIVRLSGLVDLHAGTTLFDGIGDPTEHGAGLRPGDNASPQVIFKTPVMNLTIDNTLEVPLAEQADLVNVVLFRFDKDSQGNFLTQPLSKYQKSIDRFGEVGAGQLYGEQIIESEGMRAGLQGIFLAKFVSRLIFLRYGLKNLQYEGVPHLWTACVLEPGDIVSVTNRFVPDRQAGVMGITNKLMEVMDREWNFHEGTVTLKLLDASYLSSFGGALITPDAQADFTAATADEKKKYMFLCNNSDKYSDGTAAQLLG